MNSPEMTDARDARETTRELDDARAKYRGKIIPKPALRVMDAETARLAASRLASRALKAGDSAPDFILPDAQGNPVRLYPLPAMVAKNAAAGRRVVVLAPQRQQVVDMEKAGLPSPS
ncbi:MAG TPA: hypothetical protein VK850_03395, partial [Candidatus Binatia bacterium]|nr:hypothetical protein [Candidatus Binatia bacterium]